MRSVRHATPVSCALATSARIIDKIHPVAAVIVGF